MLKGRLEEPQTFLWRSLCQGSNQIMLKHADNTVAPMKALARCKDFNTDLEKIKTQGLRHLADFLYRNLHDYWGQVLPTKIWADYFIDIDEFTGINKEVHHKTMYDQFEEAERDDPERWTEIIAWPEMTGEVRKAYADCLSRNMMAAGIVMDKKRQGMMGGVYDYSAEAKTIAARILQQRS